MGGFLLRLACDLPTVGTVLETCDLFGGACKLDQVFYQTMPGKGCDGPLESDTEYSV